MILRPDADQVLGGDTVVMQKLAGTLPALGAEVIVGRLAEMPPAREFDLLHVFTVVPIDHTRGMLAWARSGNIATLVSPLYHASYRHQFEKAVVAVPRWRRLARIAGRRPAWIAYQAWQDAKLPLLSTWRASRAALESATCVAASSRWENRYIAGHFRLAARTRRRMRISPLGIDATLYGRSFSDVELAAFRGRYGLEPGYVVEVGRLEPRKTSWP